MHNVYWLKMENANQPEKVDAKLEEDKTLILW